MAAAPCARAANQLRARVHVYDSSNTKSGVMRGPFRRLAIPCLYNGQVQRVPFAGDQIPTNLLDQAALNMVTLPATPITLGTTNNFTFNPPLTQTTDQFDVRLDQNLGASDHLFFRYSYDNSNQVIPGTLPAPANSGIQTGPYIATGLHWAAYEGHADIVRLLLNRGAPLDVADEIHGGTPLGWALYACGDARPREKERRPCYQTIALLVRAGSKVDPRWFEGDAERERAAGKMRSDPRLVAALRGEMP